MVSPTQQFGKVVEDLACKFLENNGLQLITRNFQCKYGEIDLIMQDQDVVVFVEVRYRKSSEFGDSVASVTRSKQLKLIQTAKCYLLERNIYDAVLCRFDVWACDADMINIKWIRDAFWVQWG
jgi:putative endonuclease